ncbi:uncharacterized protein DS421_15g505390 [Arachis hypogaea]|nr:uncharacterized protein LOC112747085 isoform X3 [Arachis hypogaea]QHO12261.1 uncharacterized protein DS421_15g505390 [Arachis hypogaea]
MGLLFSIIIIITLLLCSHYFSCASLQIHPFQPSLHHQVGGVNAAHQQKISLPKTVPRKLRFTDEKLEEYDDEVVVRDNNIASHEQKGSLATGASRDGADIRKDGLEFNILLFTSRDETDSMQVIIGRNGIE